MHAISSECTQRNDGSLNSYQERLRIRNSRSRPEGTASEDIAWIRRRPEISHHAIMSAKDLRVTNGMHSSMSPTVEA